MNIFDKTIDVIRERGWMLGRPVGPRGEVCAGQAMLIAAGYEGKLSRGSLTSLNAPDHELRTALRWLEHRLGMTLPIFNDSRFGGAQEVIEMLQRASVAWELSPLSKGKPEVDPLLELRRTLDRVTAQIKATTFNLSLVPNHVPAEWSAESLVSVG